MDSWSQEHLQGSGLPFCFVPLPNMNSTSSSSTQGSSQPDLAMLQASLNPTQKKILSVFLALLSQQLYLIHTWQIISRQHFDHSIFCTAEFGLFQRANSCLVHKFHWSQLQGQRNLLLIDYTLGHTNSCIPAARAAGDTWRGVTTHCPYQMLWRHLLGSCILRPAQRKDDKKNEWQRGHSGTQRTLQLCDLQHCGPFSGTVCQESWSCAWAVSSWLHFQGIQIILSTAYLLEVLYCTIYW